VAFANPNNRDVTLSFYFTDGNGVDFGGGSTVVPAILRSLDFSPNPVQRALWISRHITYTASGPIATLAARGYVNETGLFLMPQIPSRSLAFGLPRLFHISRMARRLTGLQYCNRRHDNGPRPG